MRTTNLGSALLSLLCVGSSFAAPSGQRCIVAHTPGVDDHTNVMAAFTTCKAGGTVVFSTGTDYQVMTPIQAKGLQNVGIVIDGTITFPYNNAQWDAELAYWQIAGSDLHISGTGSITADGQMWWDNREYRSGRRDVEPSGGPSVMVINVKTGSLTDVTITQARVTASSVSSSNRPAKNTDGIDVSSSIACIDLITQSPPLLFQHSGVSIHDSTIINGDDAIALAGGANGVDIRRVHCGGACHGVSIGSLGPVGKASGAAASVQNVWVEDISFEGCSTAIHIKSWPSSVQGWAHNITYKSVVLKDVGYAINL
ncbi:pectin lyase fold/virulence factor [Blyttiomyces helicus]|uniref:Pectin lyase fold/virulence factor n=1 Tax=Blyttiomyces helicus TaxID=388810 RepID=A0A4P9W2X3_9FUNG|nr:pectin lyase fold/virulence factor [Blyttiomyces helicus]|eukprot:RKO84950.1 pectin lyase fold/virulence factor [Blyttiomyces helicus]